MISPRYAITAALALAFIAGAAPHVLGWTTYWVSYVDSLRLRETPDVNGRVIGTLPKGVPAWQTETEGKIAVVNGIRNRWIKVMHGDRELARVDWTKRRPCTATSPAQSSPWINLSKVNPASRPISPTEKRFSSIT